ncbi:MAG: hypothetical protein KJ901_23705, partial [Gammaproteobacteria bacterium]|nr:hypothetical protein [Gammaproteobacteria bacterium]
PRLTPVEIVAKMGVFDARQKPYDYAWLATGDNVIATIWAEQVQVTEGGRWFIVESLDTERRAGGGMRNANQAQRAKDRLALLKRTFDAEQGFRVVLQTNRVPIVELESNRSAKVSTRVRDEHEWHVATWQPEQLMAVLVRGERGWAPTEADLQAAKARSGAPAPVEEAAAAPAAPTSPEAQQAAALDYLTRHFKGYGYNAENVSARNAGYDIEVTNAKGATLLRAVVKGASAALPDVHLSESERAASSHEPLWRLFVVTDPGGAAAQHTIYKASELGQVPGLKPQG